MYGLLMGLTSHKENGLILVLFRTQSLLHSLEHSLHSIKIDICKEGRQELRKGGEKQCGVESPLRYLGGGLIMRLLLGSNND